MMQQFLQGGGMGGGFPFAGGAGGAGFGAPGAGFGASAPAAAPAAAAPSQADLKEKYASEIQQLKDMGFCN